MPRQAANHKSFLIEQKFALVLHLMVDTLSFVCHDIHIMLAVRVNHLNGSRRFVTYLETLTASKNEVRNINYGFRLTLFANLCVCKYTLSLNN